MRIFIRDCRINNNNEFGIGISGLLKGSILIINNIINENLNGIYIKEISKHY